MADRLALVHGFTQTGSSWRPFVPSLRSHLRDRGEFEIVTPDVAGHGVHHALDPDAEHAVAQLAADVGHATYVGYSMGGRLCLHLALDRPDLVERLVLIGATAGIEDPDERSARRRADEALADDVARIGVDAFLTRWLSAPIFATLPSDAAGLDARSGNTTAGLAASLRRFGTGAQASLWSRLGELTMPVLVLAGELDEKFSAIGRRLAAAIPDATFQPVPAAGHAAYLEDPDATAAAIARWLEPREFERG